VYQDCEHTFEKKKGGITGNCCSQRCQARHNKEMKEARAQAQTVPKKRSFFSLSEPSASVKQIEFGKQVTDHVAPKARAARDD
jgi:hypothetical protein